MTAVNQGVILQENRNWQAKKLRESRRFMATRKHDLTDYYAVTKTTRNDLIRSTVDCGSRKLPRATISHYMNLSCHRDRRGNLVLVRFIDHEDGEWWSKTVLLVDSGQNDDEACDEAGCCVYYHGPGRSFANGVSVTRNGHSILLQQTGGLDI